MTTPVFTWPWIGPVHPAFGVTIEKDHSAIQRARFSMLVSTAEAEFLSILGQNVGVPRPPVDGSDDELMRRLLQVLSWQPKTILFTLYALMTAVFGSQESYAVDDRRPWRIYEFTNEIVIELPFALIGTSNENASFLHGFSGYGFVTGGPSNTFTAKGNAPEASATTLVGKNLRFNTAPNTWTDYTIATVSYNAGTDVTTFTASAATLPDGGGYFYIEIPGDNASSYRGDYLASSGFVTSYSTAAGPPTSSLKLLGDVTQHLTALDTVTLNNGTAIITTTVATLSAYDPSTNTTPLTIAVTVPGGLAGETIAREIDVSDTSTTPDHDDRVYLTGQGLYEVVSFYLDLLVRAAGIVVRLELI
jgi:hypothetical protein